MWKLSCGCYITMIKYLLVPMMDLREEGLWRNRIKTERTPTDQNWFYICALLILKHLSWNKLTMWKQLKWRNTKSRRLYLLGLYIKSTVMYICIFAWYCLFKFSCSTHMCSRFIMNFKKQRYITWIQTIISTFTIHTGKNISYSLSNIYEENLKHPFYFFIGISQYNT